MSGAMFEIKVGDAITVLEGGGRRLRGEVIEITSDWNFAPRVRYREIESILIRRCYPSQIVKIARGEER